MKINKLITKGLTLGLLFNSISISSYANIEISERYQTLEGEFITIDNSIEGNLEEIEIFGNTVQYENNLEDIQSVGDLYVDNNGKPILDKHGRKQYKLDIVSTSGLNLLDIGKEYEVGGINSNGELSTSGEFVNSDRTFNHFIELEPGKTYSLYTARLNSVGGLMPQWAEISGYNSNKEFVRRIHRSHGQQVFTMPEDIKYIKVGCRGSDIPILIEGDIRSVKTEPKNLISNVYSDYCSNYNTVSILLPTQLQKIGDTSDRLYWDSKKNKYCIDKRIMYDNFEKGVIENQAWSGQINSINFHYRIDDFFGNWGILRAYCNTLASGVAKEHYQQDTFGFITDTGGIVIKLPRDELSSLDTNGCMQWLKERNSYLYYVSKNTETIETNITSKLKMSTYDEKTHLLTKTENNLNPTLKITIDKLPQIAKEAINNAENDRSNYNISLARMYTNMLPESLYKDQLQEQLSEIFSSDIVLDKKNVSSNIDLYIKSENILMMTLNTNSITFEDFSGIEDMEKESVVQISINSSLPYSLNAYLPTEIQNSDKSVTMNKDILNIKDNSESNYQTFVNTTDKIVLKDNCSSGNDLIHNIDIKLKGGIAHQKDVYKTTIKFEAQQK